MLSSEVCGLRVRVWCLLLMVRVIGNKGLGVVFIGECWEEGVIVRFYGVKVRW